uniref:Uncharacterized protein n=1 Tax=Trichuris muris TaxID=70415 RepID=A0A5S6QKN3_TRIMR
MFVLPPGGCQSGFIGRMDGKSPDRLVLQVNRMYGIHGTILEQVSVHAVNRHLVDTWTHQQAIRLKRSAAPLRLDVTNLLTEM